MWMGPKESPILVRGRKQWCVTSPYTSPRVAAGSLRQEPHPLPSIRREEAGAGTHQLGGRLCTVVQPCRNIGRCHTSGIPPFHQGIFTIRLTGLVNRLLRRYPDSLRTNVASHQVHMRNSHLFGGNTTGGLPPRQRDARRWASHPQLCQL